MYGHRNCVFHIEEVTHLITISIVRVVALKKTDLAGSLDLFVGLGNEAAHVVFVPFVGAKHVVIFEANDFVVPSHTLCVAVEHMLGVAIHVKRIQRVEVFERIIHPLTSVTVGGCAGGIDKADTFIDGDAGECFRVFVVVTN